MRPKNNAQPWISILTFILVLGVFIPEARCEEVNKVFLNYVRESIYDCVSKGLNHLDKNLSSVKKDELPLKKISESLSVLDRAINIGGFSDEILKEAARSLITDVNEAGRMVYLYESKENFIWGKVDKRKAKEEALQKEWKKAFGPPVCSKDHSTGPKEGPGPGELQVTNEGKTTSLLLDLENTYSATMELKDLVNTLVNNHESLVSNWFSALNPPKKCSLDKTLPVGPLSDQKLAIQKRIAEVHPGFASHLKENFKAFEEKEQIQAQRRKDEQEGRDKALRHLQTSMEKFIPMIPLGSPKVKEGEVVSPVGFALEDLRDKDLQLKASWDKLEKMLKDEPQSKAKLKHIEGIVTLQGSVFLRPAEEVVDSMHSSDDPRDQLAKYRKHLQIQERLTQIHNDCVRAVLELLKKPENAKKDLAEWKTAITPDSLRSIDPNLRQQRLAGGKYGDQFIRNQKHLKKQAEDLIKQRHSPEFIKWSGLAPFRETGPVDPSSAHQAPLINQVINRFENQQREERQQLDDKHKEQEKAEQAWVRNNNVVESDPWATDKSLRPSSIYKKLDRGIESYLLAMKHARHTLVLMKGLREEKNRLELSTLQSVDDAMVKLRLSASPAQAPASSQSQAVTPPARPPRPPSSAALRQALSPQPAAPVVKQEVVTPISSQNQGMTPPPVPARPPSRSR